MLPDELGTLAPEPLVRIRLEQNDLIGKLDEKQESGRSRPAEMQVHHAVIGQQTIGMTRGGAIESIWHFLSAADQIDQQQIILLLFWIERDVLAKLVALDDVLAGACIDDPRGSERAGHVNLRR
ncbi:MAG TPA: hypothetical protein VJ487_15255 [Alphaproteobacteria bacterium]|nr:hypothetical protein [Alphaproteobacteria bacterium]